VFVSSSQQPERRRDQRISPKGTIILRSGRVDTHTLQGRIANLCLNGLSMTTRTSAPERLLGADVELSVRLDGRDSSWFELGGHILRLGATSLAMALVTVPSSFTQMIEEAVGNSHRNDRMLSIVLVDAMAERRRAMAEGFRSGGCTVIEVSTPLEAIVRLGESHFEPDLIAIADSNPGTISDEMRRFVETEHPRARLVTIGDDVNGPDGLALWLSSTNPNADLAARIRRVLTSFGRA
jgi:CheY-like chemotaxis protein